MKIFNRKNFNTFCAVFTIVTICLSIYKLINGITYDYLGFFHSLYRAIIIAIALMILYYLRHFSLKRNILDSLLEMWPLLLMLGLLLFLQYLNGAISLNLIKKYLLYGLLWLLALLLLSILLRTLLNTVNAIAKGGRKCIFSFTGLLFAIIMLLPLCLLPELKTLDYETIESLKGVLYIIAFVFLVLSVLFVLLVTNPKMSISPLCIVFIVVYYIVWVIVLLSEINLTSLILLLFTFFMPWLIYCLANGLHYSLWFNLVFVVLEIIAMSQNL